MPSPVATPGHDLLRQGSDWLQRMRHQHCAGAVQYHHDQQVFSVRATWGKTDYQVATEGGLSVGACVWDYLILAEELPGVEPEPGDVIEADGVRYEVMALGNDIRGWRWSDPFRGTYRIHTKQVS